MVASLEKQLAKLTVPKGRLSALYNGGYTDSDWRKIWAKRKQGFKWEQIHAVTKVHNSPGALGQAAIKWARETGYDTGDAIRIRRRRNTKAKVVKAKPVRKKAASRKKSTRKRHHFSPEGLKAIRANAEKARAVLAAKVSRNGTHKGELVASAVR